MTRKQLVNEAIWWSFMFVLACVLSLVITAALAVTEYYALGGQ